MLLRGANYGLTPTPKYVYRRFGSGLYDIAQWVGLDVPLMRARTPLALDYDHDGRLDLFLTALRRPDGLVPPSPYRQLPTGVFGGEFADAGQVTGYNQNTDALFALLPQDDAITAAPVYWDYQALASYQAGPRDELYLQAFGSSDSLALLFEEPNDELPELRGKLEALTQFHRGLVGWKHQYGEGYSHDIKLGVGYLVINAEIGELVKQHARSPDFYGRSEWHLPIAPWITADAGLEFVGFSGRIEYEGPEFRQTEVERTTGRVDVQLDRHVDLLRPAGYVELTLRPIEPLALIPGVRVDYFGEIDAVTVDPRLAARYGVTDATTIKAGVGNFSQPPPIGAAIPDLGNPDLGPSRALHVSAGAEQKIGPDFTIDAEGYVSPACYRPSLALSKSLTFGGTSAETSPPSDAASLTMLELT